MKKSKFDILNDSKLQYMFDCLNGTFFKDRIAPGVKVRFVPTRLLKISRKNAVDARWISNIREIHIDEIYAKSEPMSAILLLHEMAHAALDSTYIGQATDDPGHGMIYQAELYRLFMAGAYDGLL